MCQFLASNSFYYLFFRAHSWTWMIFCICHPVMTVSESLPLKYSILYLNRRCCDFRLTGDHTFHFTLTFFLDFTINSTGCWYSFLPKAFGFFQAILSVITFPGFPMLEHLKPCMVSFANFITFQITTPPLVCPSSLKPTLAKDILCWINACSKCVQDAHHLAAHC